MVALAAGNDVNSPMMTTVPQMAGLKRAPGGSRPGHARSRPGVAGVAMAWASVASSGSQGF